MDFVEFDKKYQESQTVLFVLKIHQKYFEKKLYVDKVLCWKSLPFSVKVQGEFTEKDMTFTQGMVFAFFLSGDDLTRHFLVFSNQFTQM